MTTLVELRMSLFPVPELVEFWESLLPFSEKVEFPLKASIKFWLREEKYMESDENPKHSAIVLGFAPAFNIILKTEGM